MTTQDLINTLRQGKPMTDKLMREIVRELEEKTEQLHTMGTALRAKDADYSALVEAVEWERECKKVRNEMRMFRNWPEAGESMRSYLAARAEVDRLITMEASR